MPYQEQLSTKQKEIELALLAAEIAHPPVTTIPSPKESHYRNRMDFVIDFEGRVGLRQKGKWWRVIDDHTCFISDERIESTFATVRDWVRGAGLSYFDRKRHTGFLRYAVIRTTSLGQALISIVTSAPSNATEEAHANKALLDLLAHCPDCSIVWSINKTVSDTSVGDELRVISGAGHIIEQIVETQFRIGPSAFFQTNSSAAPILLKLVQDFAGDIANSTVVDLFCGCGFFTIPCAKISKNVFGVELAPESIADAEFNASLNSVSPKFHQIKAESFDWRSVGPDVLIVDPPRSGLHPSTVKEILAAPPETMIYVSCNFRALAGELALLKDCYKIEQLTALDMFPHTPHVEVVTKLLRFK